jgi:hypothetical protein
VAPNGLAALDEASFDLMIVDIFMPHMRGFESIRIFHQRAPTVPLIAISGYAFSLLNVIDECLSEAEPQRRHVRRLLPSRARRSRERSRCHWRSRTRGLLRAELPEDAARCFRTFVGNGAAGSQGFSLRAGKGERLICTAIQEWPNFRKRRFSLGRLT